MPTPCKRFVPAYWRSNYQVKLFFSFSSIGVIDAVNILSRLFNEDPDLISGFNDLVPSKCQIDAKSQRSLFGSVDHMLESKLTEQLSSLANECSKKWNFDFESEAPLPGKFTWDQVPKHHNQSRKDQAERAFYTQSDVSRDHS